MHSLAFILSLGALFLGLVDAQSESVTVTGLLGDATAVKDNPLGVTYVATLPTKAFFNPEDPNGNIKGSMSATAGPNGVGVVFQVDFSNLPTSGGPFLYHLHEAPVPSDGNCTRTLAHIDPFQRGEVPPCKALLPQTCQVGDLSGKYGHINSDPFDVSYTDNYASTLAGSRSFFGNVSLTLHFANKTRITCANFKLASGTPSGGNGSASATGTTGVPPPSQTTGLGASSQIAVPTVLLLALLAAGLMF